MYIQVIILFIELAGGYDSCYVRSSRMLAIHELAEAQV